ncbi:Motile_Sperm domain-containing protein [Cephalotus follicularis]|uniref:Motile_Sperm domain-containing protein n=1 Tax=Cephalotus follicularis TaxID=3775 RepID=A0A1Q3B5X1_CEPFO|nr:Motile_Sperm domain-containing protein [Cephalotus follicularis]
MTMELLEIQPLELKFTFELKKQSSCSIQLGNKSDQFIAFKVKTTSPKKYCVRPNTGIIKPKATCDFTVTMQAQRVAPPDLECKDKFLIQSTVVPFGTTEEDITSDMFAKDSGKFIEDMKLRVVLVSPPQSPVLLPINRELKQETCHETSMQKDRELTGVENFCPPHRVAEDLDPINAKELKAASDVERFEAAMDTDELIATKCLEARLAEDVEEIKPAKDTVALKMADDFEKLKLRLNAMDLKMKEADITIMKLREERSTVTIEKDMLKRDVEVLRKKKGTKRVQVGFPFLYVCMVALISLAFGFFIHP